MSSNPSDLPIDPPSPADSTNTENETQSSSSDRTVNQEFFKTSVQLDIPNLPPSESTENIMSGSEDTVGPLFGNAIQKYGQQLTTALFKFKITDNLEDGNYASWSRTVFGNLDNLELHHYVVSKDYKDPELSAAQDLKTRKILVNYILNYLDKSNNTQAVNHLTDPNDALSLIYDPFSLWEFLKERHFLINSQRLASISKTLNTVTIHRSDTLSTFLDKFESLFVEFTRYGGKMDDTQSAIRLIDAITTLPPSIIEFIHATVSPLTRKDVIKYLCDYDTRQNSFSTEATREVNHVESTTSVLANSAV